MSDEVFKSTNFRYIESSVDLIPDSLIFIENGTKIKVIFDEDKGWFKSVSNQQIPHPVDRIVGRVVGGEKIFRIHRGRQTIQWIFRTVPRENIIL